MAVNTDKTLLLLKNSHDKTGLGNPTSFSQIYKDQMVCEVYIITYLHTRDVPVTDL